MEQQPPIPPPGSSLFEMDLDAIAQQRLNTISKWGKFIAITVLIFIGLFVLALAVSYQAIIDRAGSMMSLSDKFAGILVAIVAVIIILFTVSMIYLLRACILIKQGLISQNSDRIAEGFKAFKVVFTISIIFSVLTILSSLSGFIQS